VFLAKASHDASIVKAFRLRPQVTKRALLCKQALILLREKQMEQDELTRKVIGCAMEVHKALGPGLLESVYEKCLAIELADNDIKHETEKAINVEYKGKELDCGFRADFVIEDELIVELKAVDKILQIHEAQLLTYMKLANIKTGLLINFNVMLLKDGIKRFVL